MPAVAVAVTTPTQGLAKTGAKVLVVEDDPTLSRGLELNLSNEGFQVFKAGSGEACINSAARNNPEVIILDIMLPDESGLDVCRELRTRGIESVIVILTVKAQEIDKVVGLEVGADDYMTKPFSVRELVARLRAHLRRQPACRKDEVPRYLFADIEIDFRKFQVQRGRRELRCTPKEFELLKLMVTHRGELLSREEILRQVWGYEAYPTTRTVDNHILKLRQKLEPDPLHPRYILSVYGEGYQFVG